jgi:hypothetical protein
MNPCPLDRAPAGPAARATQLFRAKQLKKLEHTGRYNMNAPTQAAIVQTPGTQARPLSYHNWVQLNPGDRVIVKRSGFAPEHGTVDDVGEDASYFWVWIDGQSRVLIFHGDGSAVHKILP